MILSYGKDKLNLVFVKTYEQNACFFSNYMYYIKYKQRWFSELAHPKDMI